MLFSLEERSAAGGNLYLAAGGRCVVYVAQKVVLQPSVVLGPSPKVLSGKGIQAEHRFKAR